MKAEENKFSIPNLVPNRCADIPGYTDYFSFEAWMRYCPMDMGYWNCLIKNKYIHRFQGVYFDDLVNLYAGKEAFFLGLDEDKFQERMNQIIATGFMECERSPTRPDVHRLIRYVAGKFGAWRVRLNDSPLDEHYFVPKEYGNLKITLRMQCQVEISCNGAILKSQTMLADGDIICRGMRNMLRDYPKVNLNENL